MKNWIVTFACFIGCKIITFIDWHTLKFVGETQGKTVFQFCVGSVNKFVFLEINGSFLVRIRIWKFLSKRSVFMPVAKEQSKR